jgi:hypothetical protein
MKQRLKREEETLMIMIKLYCKNSKHAENIPCNECAELMSYATNRLTSCKFGDNKPVCAKCKIHCYESQMRNNIRLVMKNTGLKMIVHHPILLFNHMVDAVKY